MKKAKVQVVSMSRTHTMSKFETPQINLISGIGVDGDAHAGKYVKHQSRVAKDPTQPNLRQIHLIHAELFEELATRGFSVLPGQMGENITTEGIDLLNLPRNTVLKIGTAEIKVTGLRNPCTQLNGLQNGLMNKLVYKDSDGNLVRKAGIMGVVQAGGTISKGDDIKVILPEGIHIKLDPV